MKALTKAEKFIKTAFKSDDSVHKQTCELFLWHFKCIDKVENTRHLRAINFLYRIQNTKYTKQSIADEMFINVKSLKAAREKYVGYFLYFYEVVSTGRIAEESAISWT